MRLCRAAVLAVLLPFMIPAPAHAAARVTISPATADPDYATVLTVRGSGFQSVPKGYGGLYLLFGWVADGAWQPSKGGASGATYRYVPDKEAKDNRGFQRFIAFPGSDTASSANGGEISPDGSWQTELVVPGARFRATDRNGAVVDVDCLKVRCGLITVGAHGVPNATNETFTPMTFAVPRATTSAAAPPATSPPGTPSTTTTSAPTTSTSDSPTRAAATSAAAQSTATAAVADSRTTVWWLVSAAALLVTAAALIVPPLLRRRRTSNDRKGTNS